MTGARAQEELTLCWAAWDPANALVELSKDFESYYLPVAVTNRGGRTAEEVVVQAEVAESDGSSQASEFTLDFLAGGETREGTAVFATDPSAGELTIAVASFQSS